jgi:hypothetical protein
MGKLRPDIQKLLRIKMVNSFGGEDGVYSFCGVVALPADQSLVAALDKRFHPPGRTPHPYESPAKCWAFLLLQVL